MSNEQFAWLLAFLNLTTGIGAIAYYTNYKKEPAALIASLVFFLFFLFFLLFAGAVKDPEMAFVLLYADSIALAFVLFALSVFLFYLAWKGPPEV